MENKFYTTDGNKPTIKFYTLQQAAVYTAITGQISDGIWENSSPSNHYQIMCAAIPTVAAEGETVGLNFAPLRNYGLGKCWEYSSEEIIMTAKVITVFPELLGQTFYKLPEIGLEKKVTWENGVRKVEGFFTAGDIAEIEAVDYSEKQARNDLRIVNNIVARRDHGVNVTKISKMAKKIAKAIAMTETAKSETASTRLTAKAINKAIAATGSSVRVEGANGIILLVNGENKITNGVSKWSALTIEQWIDAAKSVE